MFAFISLARGSLTSWFVSILFVIAAIAKLAVVYRGGAVMAAPHPIFVAPFRHYLIALAMIEFGLAFFMLSKASELSKAIALLWFSCCALSFHALQLVWGLEIKCSCFGLWPRLAEKSISLIVISLFLIIDLITIRRCLRA